MANDDSFTRRGGDRANDVRRSGGGGGRDRSPLVRGNKGGRNDCRVFVSNLPYEYRWQDLKDMLRREVGEVAFVELFTDEHDKPKGCGIVEFESADSVKKAIDKLHRYDVDGRKIIVKEDYGAARDKCGNLIRNRDRDRHDDNRNNRGDNNNRDGNQSFVWGETYGLSPGFLEGLNISPPLVSRVFVANLDYKVTEKKLRDVFKLAGKVREVELSMDADGKSRGFGVIEYDHPVESVQAISMLHNQQLYDRRLIVRMDRVDPQERERLPEGLSSVGMGLGQNGAPLKDVSRNLPQITTNSLSALQQTQNNISNLTAAAALQAAAPLSIGGLPSAAALQAAAALAPSSGGGLMNTSNLDLLTGRSHGDLSARDLGFSNLAGLSSSLSSGLGNNLGQSLGQSLGSSLSSNMMNTQQSMNNSSGHRNGTLSGIRDSASDRLPSNSMGRDSYDNRNNSQIRSNEVSKASDTIVIDNLPKGYTWQQLKDKFRDIGEIKFAEMRGQVGLVRFGADWEALRAVSLLDRTRVDGSPISVRLF